ncbi:hypothetical protein BH10ACI2_BH10ACI2_08040 [soil metagenome]
MKEQETQKLLVKHIVRKIFFEDWALKLLALLITFALWFGVTGLSTPTTKRVTVPLNLNIASNAQIVNTPPTEVTIDISGDKRKLEQLNRGDLSVSIDLTDTPSGDRLVLLSTDNVYVPLPQGMRLVDIAPRSIAVNLEAVEEKEIEVKIETTGAPSAGYEIYGEPTALPQKIRVRGPASVMRILESVKTEPIDLTSKKDPFIARQVPVSASNPQAAVLNTVVDVAFRIGEKRIERTFTAPVIGLMGKTATFILFGPKTMILKAKIDDFKVEMILDGNGSEVPQVVLPPEMQSFIDVKKVTLK